MDAIETANWFPKLARKDFQIGLNDTVSAVDDPDQQFFENYGCGPERNYTGYCNRDLEVLFVEQSMIADQDRAPEARLGDRQKAATGRRTADPLPHANGDLHATAVKGLTVIVNSQYNGWRMEDLRLDR